MLSKQNVEVIRTSNNKEEKEKLIQKLKENAGPNDLFIELTIPSWLKGKENAEKLFIEKAQDYINRNYASTLEKGGHIYVGIKQGERTYKGRLNKYKKLGCNEMKKGENE